MKQLEGIVKKFTSLTKAHFGEVDVIVTSVVPLQEKEEKELKQLLQMKLNKEKFLSIQEKALDEEEANEFKQLFRRKNLSTVSISEKDLMELKELLKKHTAGKTPLMGEELERFNLLARRFYVLGGKLNRADLVLTELENKDERLDCQCIGLSWEFKIFPHSEN